MGRSLADLEVAASLVGSRQDFKEHWTAQAREEMRENENWEMWAIVTEGIPNEGTRIIPWCKDSGGFFERDPDDYLQWRRDSIRCDK